MVDSELPALLRKDEKSKINLGFVSREQINIEMNALLKQYGATRSQADLDKTRKILKRFGAINDELAAMRDENR
jgi:hypothetical protein